MKTTLDHEPTQIKIEMITKLALCGAAYDSAIQKTLYSVCDAIHYGVGPTGISNGYKTATPLISKKAQELFYSMLESDGTMTNENKKLFSNMTIGDHSNPNALLYKELCETENLDVNKTYEILKKHFCVTITKEEDDEMNSRGFRSNGSIEERYGACGIEIVEDFEVPRQRLSKKKFSYLIK